MSKYLKIVMQNLEPIRISDDSTSQSGQTVSLRYIPGTAVRGIVVNALAGTDEFEKIKKTLFSTKVRYLNAYLTDGEKELIPSPKGFYEDKTETDDRKKLENVVINGQFTEGQKRASLGRFCRIEEGCIFYYNIDTGSDMKIKINLKDEEKQNVFRNEHMASGHVFTGYIVVEDEDLKERIREVFSQDIIIGNGRSAGLGKCRVLSCDYVDDLPYKEYLADEDRTDSCYMMLLSNTVMRDEKGEFCGLNLRKLEKQLGVEDLEILFCSTSTVDVKGYNSVWRTKTPSVVMYEQGSVFHLKYGGMLTVERMRTVCDQGIGARLNEGFGRVMFLKGYEKIQYKKAETYIRKSTFMAEDQQYEEDRDTLKIAARGYYRNMIRKAVSRYVVEKPLPRGKISNSQLGTLESYAAAYKYEPCAAEKMIRKYFLHTDSKAENARVQKEKNGVKELEKYILHIMDTELEVLLSVETRERGSIMGISKKELFTPEEWKRMKLEMVIRMIRYDKKKEER
ncbi:MAG: hypothetical protein HFH59_05440 [Lachnospiraceae bacterium]|jgi:CRISPR-associated protein Csx10|nr:hypothetical protein [Lachnospiraceae bacterium]MCI9356976.1 hypothetical protein [Lachnospiraceae bacterium]